MNQTPTDLDSQNESRIKGDGISMSAPSNPVQSAAGEGQADITLIRIEKLEQAIIVLETHVFKSMACMRGLVHILFSAAMLLVCLRFLVPGIALSQSQSVFIDSAIVAALLTSAMLLLLVFVLKRRPGDAPDV